jgi:hypothetical protein
MAKPRNPKVQRRLDSYQRDYQQVTGRPFKYFFCPILGVDEPGELIRGHVINQAFAGAPRAWVIQRSDVDNFYGAHFESDFEPVQFRDRFNPIEVLADPVLSKKLRPKILMNGEPIVFTSQPAPPPDRFVQVLLGEDPNAPSLGIKMSRDEMIASAGEQWEFVMFKDARIPALVSLIKAAHLTLFYLLGYRYATSAAGLFVGRDILGRFFRSNSGHQKKEIQANAWTDFREFRSMFRPLRFKNVGYEGTITDRRLLVCHATNGRIWAQIVLISAANQMHAVMVPAFDSADSVPTFLDFLENDNERIQVSTGEFDPRNRRWIIYADRREQIWPKQGLLYPEGPEAPPTAEAVARWYGFANARSEPRISDVAEPPPSDGSDPPTIPA